MKLPRPDYQWREKNRQTRFDNPWMRVDDCAVIDPSGTDRQYGLVHFKNSAIGIIPYEAGHIWLVGQSRFSMGAYSWEIPAGGCPHDQDKLMAARRELREETGIIAKKFSLLSRFHLSNSITDEAGRLYLATGLSHGSAQPEICEDISVKKITLDQAYAAAQAGEITQAVSLLAIYKLVIMRQMGELD